MCFFTDVRKELKVNTQVTPPTLTKTCAIPVSKCDKFASMNFLCFI